MDRKMTVARWRKLAECLLFRKSQLEEDLKNENYDLVESIRYSKNQQLEAIKTLLEQVPYEYKVAQQKMHPTKNGRGKSDKVSTPAVFGG